MTLVFNLLLFIHIVSVVVGASTNVAMPIIAARMAAAGPDSKAMLGGIAGQMSKNSQRALLTLVITGLTMVAIVIWEGRVTSPSPWFIAKIALVLALGGVMLSRGLPFAKSAKPATFGLMMRVCLLGIIFCSVMAFN